MNRFDEIQRNLGISRKTLTNRLSRLVDLGLLQKKPYLVTPPRYEYRLTHRSLDSYPYAMCLLHWGDHWLADPGKPPVTLRHKPCGKIVVPLAICKSCNREIRPEDVNISRDTTHVSQEYWNVPLRCSPRQELYTAGRASSVSRAAAKIGDRWGFFVLWLALAGVRRFEDFRQHLGIARTMLTSRLDRLLSDGLIERDLYCQRPPRYQYRLTNKGRALCPALLAFYDWSVRWQGASASHSKVRHKTCGYRLRTDVVCSHCLTTLQAYDVEVAGTN